MSYKLVRQHGLAIIEVINQAIKKDNKIPVVKEASREQRDQIKKLSEQVKIIGRLHEIAPALIANRASLEDLVLGGRDLTLLQGWRNEVAGEKLLSLLKNMQMNNH